MRAGGVVSLRVVQVNCVLDPKRRAPDALLADWSTLPAVAEASAGAGAEVIVVQASHMPARFRRRGVEYRFVPVSPPAIRVAPSPAPWQLARAVRAAAPDVVHLNGLDFPLHARLLSGLDAPLLLQDHACHAARLGMAPLRRWGHRRASGAAFTARAQADPFVETGQLPRDLPIFVIPESSSAFTPGARETARARTGVTGDPALLWIGHLNANKDPLTAIRAAARALELLPGLELWCAFIGTGLLDEVRAALRAHPALAARTHLLGAVPRARIEDLCRASDLFVSTSRREGSGYALIEALACGLPPVATDIPSFRDLTGEGDIGALVAPGSADGFAAAIVKLAHQPREATRRAVRAHFDRHASFEVVGRRLLDAYSSMLRLRSAA